MPGEAGMRIMLSNKEHSLKSAVSLIVAEGTETLTTIPASRSEDDVLSETRDVVMAVYGAARIVEISHTYGEIDERYRRDY